VPPVLAAGEAAAAGKNIQVSALPGDSSTALRARALVEEALSGLGVECGIVRDAMLMISELATNAFQHASRYGPHELWIAVVGDEAVCAVFDRRPMDDFSRDLTFSGDCGRGLAIVAELSEGRWGIERAESRLRHGAVGKAVWFARPLSG
jgi:anti-sigma regulatory factor (Ser/Thr protein kinase)